MMEKKIVSKCVLTLCNLFFYSGCLSGLIWQVTQISINYFGYGVVSTITILMPGNEPPKSITICFKAFQVLNHTALDQIIRRNGWDKPKAYGWLPKAKRETKLSRPPPPLPLPKPTISEVISYLTVQQRFNIAVSHTDALPFSDDSGKLFILNDMICYQSNPMNRLTTKLIRATEWLNEGYGGETITISLFDMRQNPTFVMVVLSEQRKLPTTEFLLTAPIMGNISSYEVSSYFYETNRLRKPYEDNCFDYKTIDLIDRRDAVEECVNRDMISNSNISNKYKIFTQGYNHRISRFVEKDLHSRCEKEIRSKDCHEQVHFTSISQFRIEGLAHIFQKFSKYPSFYIESHSKIDDIDFITYIFGAMGTWFGFSFLMINPFQYILTNTNESDVNPSTSQTQTVIDIRFSQMNQSISKSNRTFSQSLSQLRNEINDMNDRQQHLLQCIQSININLRQINHKLDTETH